MGWKLTGGASGIDADVDTTFKALRVSIRPAEVSGWFSVGARSGAATAVAAAGAVFTISVLFAPGGARHHPCTPRMISLPYVPYL